MQLKRRGAGCLALILSYLAQTYSFQVPQYLPGFRARNTAVAYLRATRWQTTVPTLASSPCNKNCNRGNMKPRMSSVDGENTRIELLNSLLLQRSIQTQVRERTPLVLRDPPRAESSA